MEWNVEWNVVLNVDFYLMDKGRMDVLKRAMEDEDYRKKLLEELDLQNNSR